MGRLEMCTKRATQDVTAAEGVAEEVVVVEAAVVAEEGEVEGESFYLGITQTQSLRWLGEAEEPREEPRSLSKRTVTKASSSPEARRMRSSPSTPPLGKTCTARRGSRSTVLWALTETP